EKVGQLKLVLASTDPTSTPRNGFGPGYIYVDWGTSFAMFHARRFGEMPPASLQVNLASIALSYLTENTGSAYLPLTIVEQTDSLYQVKGTPAFNRPIYATFREGNDQPELIRQVIDLLRGVSV
ncbi:MAG TPA: hypothetical protein VJ998_12785, partial [Pseudomonadales bacterium]|nr:hypothetical protein [Pseudomonadales bacterium]